MSITATLAKMKNYFETWHTKEYDRLHTAYDDSSVRNLIEDIKNKLPKDQFGNITQIYSKTDVDNFISNLNNQVTGVRNSLSNYYSKTEVDSKVSTLQTSINGKFGKNESAGGWRSIIDDAGVNPSGWTSSNFTIYVNEAIHMGHINFNMPFDSATKGKWYEWTYITVPAKYRPTGTQYGSCRIEGTDTGILAMNNKGHLCGMFGVGWSVGNAKTVSGSVFWRY